MNSIAGRLGGICAALFAVLMVIGVALALDQPENDAPDAEWTSFVNDDGNLVRNIIGGYALVIAAILFLVFAVTMYQRLRAADADAMWSMITLVTGIGFSFCLMVGALMVVTIAGGMKLGDSTPASAETARWLPQLGLGVILVAGGLTASLMMAVMNALILRTKALPAWIGYFGYLGAVGLLLAAAFLPMIVFLLYMLVLGIVLLMRNDQPVLAAA